MKVAVLAGGRSSEHDVSLASAASVLDGLEASGHTVEPIVIGRDGIWRNSDPRVTSTGREPVAIVPGGGAASLLKVGGGDSAEIDVYFPVLHGPFGEDGTVQGVLESANLPYVGAGVEASALCMNKKLFKILLNSKGLPQPKFVVVEEREHIDTPREAVSQALALGLPLFVKPATLGSSVGISKVTTPDQLNAAIELALKHCPTAIIEQGIAGKEVECAVIGVTSYDVSPPGEIRYDGTWYDFDAKYGDGGMELVLPAEISASCARQVQDLAQATFEVTGCQGMARIDFFVTDGGQPLISELNSIPGFTPTSVFARLFKASGLEYEELLDRLLNLALERYEWQARYRY